jgi:signal peptidase I
MSTTANIPSAIETADKRRDTLRPKLRRSGIIEEVIRTVVFVFVVTVLFDMAIPRSLVEGKSMYPTFETGDRLIVSRMNYMLSKPSRGEIVVFNSINPSERARGVMLIKRIIGLPGETIEFRNNQLYINGQLTNEPYTPDICQTGCSDDIWVLTDEQYFVMGDNRNASQDSRRFGPISIADIVGEAVFRYWPPNKFGLITGFDYDN